MLVPMCMYILFYQLKQRQRGFFGSFQKLVKPVNKSVFEPENTRSAT